LPNIAPAPVYQPPLERPFQYNAFIAGIELDTLKTLFIPFVHTAVQKKLQIFRRTPEDDMPLQYTKFAELDPVLTRYRVSTMHRHLLTLITALMLLLTSRVAVAQDSKETAPDSVIAQDEYPGTEDFEKANRIRVTSTSREALAEVIELCQSALKKGLDEIDTPAAKTMIATTALQRAQTTIEEASGGRAQGNRMARIANEAMKDLDIAIEADPKLVDALILKGRIHVLRTELKKGLETLEQAQAALEETLTASKDDSEAKTKLSDVLMMKSVLRQDADERLQDLMKAIEVNPDNERAVQQSVETLINLGRFEDAQATIKKFLEASPENEYAIRRLTMLMIQDEQFQPALEFLTSKIEAFPNNSALYGLRGAVAFAQASQTEDKAAYESAIADCTKAIELDPENLDAVLSRAKIYLANKDLENAKKDLETLESKRPDIPDLTLLRMDIAIQEKRYADAITDMERLVQVNPENRLLLLQLGSFYQMDNRPKKALRIADRLITSDPADWQALRLRGDVRLALGNHAEAIEDYESAIENIPEDNEDYSGVLNNLSWVLSTSPEDSVRNGARALELALKACELTKYEKAHILSTLAAAYAESQQFDKAKEWATKAVELGRQEGHDQLEQLEKELKNYEEGKPWREKQEVKEKPGKAAPADSGVDT
jgi:tetratricopeptide (TPR) repeat protein